MELDDPNFSLPYYKKIKSRYILKYICGYVALKRLLELIKYNHSMKKLIDISNLDYEKFAQLFSTIKIDIIPVRYLYKNFINFSYERDFIHVFFNNNYKIEIDKCYLDYNEDIDIINIIIDPDKISLNSLFSDCYSCEKIIFKKFYRNNINDMSFMFYNCINLREIDLHNFNTDNVIDFSHMFESCDSLQKLDLSNFNTRNVLDMSYMFNNCSSIQDIKFNNFNTINVINMKLMFNNCYIIKKLNLESFNTNLVIDMSYMFANCHCLIYLNLKNFIITDKYNLNTMFLHCSHDLKMKVNDIYDKNNKSCFF